MTHTGMLSMMWKYGFTYPNKNLRISLKRDSVKQIDMIKYNVLHYPQSSSSGWMRDITITSDGVEISDGVYFFYLHERHNTLRKIVAVFPIMGTVIDSVEYPNDN